MNKKILIISIFAVMILSFMPLITTLNAKTITQKNTSIKVTTAASKDKLETKTMYDDPCGDLWNNFYAIREQIKDLLKHPFFGLVQLPILLPLYFSAILLLLYNNCL